MKVTPIVTALLVTPVLGSLFFQESKADKIKANLDSIGYEILDSAGLVKDSVFETFDKDSLKAWLEAHGVTDASKQTVETAKKHKDWLLEDIQDYASKSQDYSAALLNKGKDFYAQQTTAASDYIWKKWSDSKLKEFLDARGVNVPQGSTHDQLVALVARSKYKSPVNFNGPSGNFWFDGWSRDELVKKLQAFGESAEGTRKELASRLHASYNKAYGAGQKKGNEAADRVVEKGNEAADNVKDTVGGWREATVDSFNSWSLDDLKDYLSDYGYDVSGTKKSLVNAAKDNYYYFVHGEVPPKNFIERAQRYIGRIGSGAKSYFDKLLGVQAFVRSDL